MSQGPVCHLPSPTVATTPDPKSLPSIPPAQPNLASLTATVNALRQVIMVYTGQMGQAGRQGQQGAAGKDAPAGSWTQTNIQTSKVKIYQNNDPSTGNYVEVERVDGLTMGNKITNQTWQFNRPKDTGNG